MQAALAAPARVRGPGAAGRVLDGVPWDPVSAALDEASRQARARGMLAGRAAWLAHPLFTAARQRPAVASQPGGHGRRLPRASTGPAVTRTETAQPLGALDELAMPVLVAVGEHDVPGFREMSAVLARGIPAAQYRLVSGAGHMINLEQPGVVNELLSRFLDRLATARPVHQPPERRRGTISAPLGGPEMTATPESAVRDAVLVDPEWLEAHRHDPFGRVVEVDIHQHAYDEWHIDGAVLWNVYTDLKDADYRLAGAAALQQVVRPVEDAPDSTVVFYGYAPALGFWLMKLYGHADVRILDCSRDTWLA